jgi:penicillin amidase
MKRLKKILLIALIIIVVVFIAVYFLLRQTLPPVKGKIILKGISHQVSMTRNRWGVPRIEARNRGDLFFAIGFLHASDRLFQMDLTRRMASGRLSEIFGERTLDTDRYHKDLLIEESVEKSLENLSPANRKILQHYCDGVNAFIQNQKLPPEFTLLNYKPELWTAKDTGSIYKRMEILLAGSGSELYNAKIIEALGADKAKKFISGAYGETIINPNEYRDSTGQETLKIALQKEIDLMEARIGSNSWVISGTRSATGHPILANDQHLPNIFPSFFYQISARVPDLNLCGNTIPGIPLMIFGRTATMGWGFTNIGTDVIDYFILDINPENPNQYKLDDKWVDFEIIEKNIRIKNKGEVSHKIKMSKFGPVFEENRKFMARHSIMQYPSESIEAFAEMNFARNLDEFIQAARKFSSPAQNLVFADTKGNIGYFPCGLIPIRKKGDGNIPVPVTKTSESWEGFYQENKKPFLLNPEKGYIVTANNPVVPKGCLPLFAKTWDPYFRADRIDGLLASKKVLTIEDNRKIQTDSFLKNAEFLVGRIKKFNFESPKAGFVLDRLKNWNFRADTGISPYLFYRFEYYLNRNTFADHIENPELKNLVSSSWIYRILNYPETETDSQELAFWTDDVRTPEKENFRDMVEKSLVETFDEYKKKSEKKDLSWESLHTLTYRHPLGSIFLLKSLLNRGPYFMPGGYGCILTTSFRRNKDFDIVHLSAFRMIMDFSDFSNSLMINASGQSGHFMSPHYDDQIELFIKLKYRLMESPPSEPGDILRLNPSG